MKTRTDGKTTTIDQLMASNYQLRYSHVRTSESASAIDLALYILKAFVEDTYGDTSQMKRTAAIRSNDTSF
eukprot:1653476-Pleurochrysis_carterae.AAC.1